MNIKCIAIGNRIMKDDSIGINIIEAIKDKLINKGVSVYIGETDLDLTINELNDVDLVFIVDSSYFNLEPGTITITAINEHLSFDGQIYSQHQPSIIHFIKTYKKQLIGYIIGIEIEEISFGLQLSDCLAKHFNKLCDDVFKIIINKIEETKNA